jgi:hypothetical protein
VSNDPGQRESPGKQALTFALFLLKMLAFLAGLGAFGFAVFWLRRLLP